MGTMGDISYWCCAMCDSSMYFHQADKPALEEWYTYMDKEYGMRIRFRLFIITS